MEANEHCALLTSSHTMKKINSLWFVEEILDLYKFKDFLMNNPETANFLHNIDYSQVPLT